MKKRDYNCVVISNKKVAPDFYKMKLSCEKIAFKPGQFFQITAPGSLLRRPFAASECDGKSFSYTYQIVGDGTDALQKMRKGDSTKVLAPLGNGYTLPKKSTRAILVGGGCGTPSLCLLASALKEKGIETYSIIGARSSCSLLEKNTLKKLTKGQVISTDDGSEGIKGHAVMAVEKLLNKIGEERIEFFACGPHPMLAGLAKFAESKNIKCQVSLEEKMACGFGACMGCAVKVRAENSVGFKYLRVCHDGPVFNATDLIWQ
jgi:dihydroorotate dehydrogenase electron transfer subunit